MSPNPGARGLASLSPELLRDILDHIEADPEKLISLDRRAYLSQESFKLPGPPSSDQSHDIASFRLVCKRFSDLGAIHQFSRIATRFSRHGFARLEKIADQPHLARHVKKFSYMVPYFYEAAPQRQRDPALGHQVGLASIDARKFLLKINEQKQLVASGEDARVLTKALAAFTSLQHVQILRVQDRDDALLLTYLRQHQDGPQFLELKWAPACSHCTKTLGAALLESHSPCSRFSSPMLSPQSAGILAAKTPTSFKMLVQRLTSLELHFDDGNNLDTIMSELSDLFRKVFMSAENMQALHIGFPSHRPLNLPLDDIFHNVKWRQLAAFGIQAWKLDAEEIIGLVRRHRDRLRGLRLRDVLLKDGSKWQDVLGYLRHEVPHLEWVSLRRIGYAKTFDEQWAARGAEIPDEPRGGAPSDSDEEDMMEIGLVADDHDDDDSVGDSDGHSGDDDHDEEDESDEDDDEDDSDEDDDSNDHHTSNNSARNNTSTTDTDDGTDDEHGPHAETMSFPLNTTFRGSPISAPSCSCVGSASASASTTSLDALEQLGDNGVFVSNAQRKLWERWVVPRRCARGHAAAPRQR